MKYIQKTSLLLFLLLTGIISVKAQAPAWSVKASNFQYTMTVTAFLNVEGKTLASPKDMVAAFVGDEVRGVASLIHVENEDRYLAFLTIYGNKENDQIEFKIFDQATGQIVAVDRTVDFVIDGQFGNVFQAFSIAKPALNNQAEIEKFYFKNADTVSTSISPEKVEIVLADNRANDLIPEFTVSSGAKVFIDRAPQESGSLPMDFTFPVSYSVLSEDESTLNTYEVAITDKQENEGPSFVCSNVITANGDGSNDFWIVQNTADYEDYTFTIFDINGRVLKTSEGYHNDWDGYHNGKKLDRGKYYYKVENKVKNSAITGSILLIY